MIFAGLPSVASLRVILVSTLLLTSCRPAGPDPEGVERVQVVRDDSGFRLTVDDREFFVMGMNWDYFPVGTNYSFRLWDEPDDIIEEALDREMTLLQSMGVNAIRQYVGVPPRWVAWIHARYGIYTVINHPLGRYGVSIDGAWTAPTDYADPRARESILAEIDVMVESYRNSPGVLMWLLGNENNYGLVWEGAETENLPEEQRDVTRATSLYTLVGEAARRIKQVDTLRPVALANGDVGYLDLIARYAVDIDIFGMNTYRGPSFTDAWETLASTFDRPVLLTEFGSDAWNARTGQEAGAEQAALLLAQWQEVYTHAPGQGGFGNSIGGLTFQWSDGWWKYHQEDFLDVHDTHASWANGGYAFDYEEGKNNMNEEWFGVMAKGPTDERMQFELSPRAAYFTLQRIHRLNPLESTPEEVETLFSNLDINSDVERARDARRAVD